MFSLVTRFMYHRACFVAAVETVAVDMGVRPFYVAQRLNEEIMRTRVVRALEKPLLYKLAMTGNSMAPLLNEHVLQDESRDVLFVRRIPIPSEENVFTRDVVVLSDPRDKRRKYVRRIVAVSGDEMVSDREPEKYPPFNIPKDHCWVMCDNPSAPMLDSRTFGALSLDHIIGRAIYAVKNATEHYRIKNSDQSMNEDDTILTIEKPVLLLQST